ncbi:DNA polymerase III subunit beta [Arthrobacter sp. StoSoilB22]|uniref:DNA polymerase III subunit beta n=1 Tax=Arthrobacter sp. StoSoilB22 TaxID=2830996 RepID=UPI001CC40B56|nr:DNA polymerase III subunit beta [Arthrobacter sp. StoSoilB22]BCW61884.1 DNA polymerase III subunit beta [Arthrobacter sp. StoSoilB22]
MKFSIPANALADAAAFAAKGISPRPANPILSGLLIEAAAGTLRISGFDYDKSARTQTAADIERDGNALLPGKMFTDIIKKFGKKTVTVEVDGTAAKLTAGSAVFTIGSMKVSDFPPMPPLPQSAGTVDGDVLAAAVAQIIDAASTDASVPALMGVKVISDGNELILLATDRYRLAEVSIPWTPSGDGFEALVRATWLRDAAKNLAGETQILMDGNNVGIRAGNRATTTTVLDQDFPKIRALFPTSTETEIVVDRAELGDVVSRVSLVAESNTPIRITASGTEMIVEAGTGESAQGKETIPCEVDGTDVVVAVNPAYLGWSLSVTTSENITLGFQENRAKPVLITGHESLSHLIMPVRL